MRDLENISLEELEKIACDESISLPEGLEDEVRSSISLLAICEDDQMKVKTDSSRRRVLYYCSAAASLALLIGAGIGISDYSTRPKDTFTDPYEAYAELEKAFDLISNKVEKGAGLAQSANASVAERTNELMTKISK